VYLGDALGDDVIRERGELLLQLVEQLHDSDVRAVALPHHGPPSSWQGLPAGARYIIVTCRRSSTTYCRTDTKWSGWSFGLSFKLITRAKRDTPPRLSRYDRNTVAMTRERAKSARNNAIRKLSQKRGYFIIHWMRRVGPHPDRILFVDSDSEWSRRRARDENRDNRW